MKFWKTFKTGIHAGVVIALLGCSTLPGQRSRPDETTTDLEDFVIYAQPDVFDALRNRPFSKKDPVVEAFFESIPAITQRVFDEHYAAMEAYFNRCKREMDEKLFRLARLAGLEAAPPGLVEGYEERIDTLETLLTWMRKEMPVQIERLDIWQESELKWKLERGPVPNIRIHPETGEFESRFKAHWEIISKRRERSKDLILAFDLGFDLQDKTGYYNPGGFLHWSQLSRRDLKALEITYPVIITGKLRRNLNEELPAYLSAYEETLNCFYHILEEYFFSDLADIHALYILTRGRIFSDLWHQYQATPLLRGLAAQLVFKTLEGRKRPEEVDALKQDDWTTWHLRKIGSEYNPVLWEGETAPYIRFGAYKEYPNLANIYWSTRFVQSLMDQYGESLINRTCRYLAENNRGRPIANDVLFREVTGASLEQAIREFIGQSGKS